MAVALFWQQIQLHRQEQKAAAPATQAKETAESRAPNPPPRHSPTADASKSGGGLPSRAGRPNVPALLAERREAVRNMGPEETGQRMFEELKIVVGEDQAPLPALVELLVQEGRSRRQLEEQAKAGEITPEALAKGIEHLRSESEAQAESMLTPRQFDRYREVRQSWRRGREHPDRDSLE